MIDALKMLPKLSCFSKCFMIKKNISITFNTIFVGSDEEYLAKFNLGQGKQIKISKKTVSKEHFLLSLLIP